VTVAADAIAAAGTDPLVVVDPHTPSLEAQCRSDRSAVSEIRQAPGPWVLV
jgi:ribose-phosphate pyrophosphokinase